MNESQLIENAGYTHEQIDKWVKLGMPHRMDGKERHFFESEVISWLVENGHAEIDLNKVAFGLDGAAVVLSVPRDVVRKWGGLPGYPGSQGYFPIEEIREWATSNHLFDTIPGAQQATASIVPVSRLQTLREEEKLLDIQEKRGDLISPQEMIDENARLFQNLNAVLNLLASLVDQKMPVFLTPTIKAIVREVVAGFVEEARHLFAEAIDPARKNNDDNPSSNNRDEATRPPSSAAKV